MEIALVCCAITFLLGTLYERHRWRSLAEHLDRPIKLYLPKALFRKRERTPKGRGHEVSHGVYNDVAGDLAPEAVGPSRRKADPFGVNDARRAMKRDVVSALTQAGFSNGEAVKAADSVPYTASATVESWVRASLRELSPTVKS